MAVSVQQRSEGRFNPPLFTLLLLAIILLGAYAARSQLEAEQEPAALATAREASDLVRNYVGSTIDEAVNLAGLVRRAKESGSGREIIRGLAVPTAQLRPEYVGVAVVFEPNGFDGRDAEFKAEGLENDSSGRFVPYYYNKSDGTVGIDPLIMTVEAGIEGWYLPPLRSGKPYLTDPYVYPINGVDMFMVTISVPLVSQGHTFGVTTIDFTLKDLQHDLANLSSPETGEVMLLAGDQSLIFHPDAQRIGTKLLSDAEGAVAQQEEADISEALTASRSADETEPFRFTAAKGGAVFILNRVAFDSVEDVWTIIVRQPYAPASMDAWMRAASMPAIVAAIAFGIVFVLSLAVGIVRPNRLSNAGTENRAAVSHGSVTREATIVRRRDR